MLESLVHEVTGVKVVSMHHDISTVSGEEVVVVCVGRIASLWVTRPKPKLDSPPLHRSAVVHRKG